MVVPKNVLNRLLYLADEKQMPFVCASYPLKEISLQGSALSVKGETGKVESFPEPFNEREENDGVVECNWVVPMGCCIFNLNIVRQLPKPCFKYVEASSSVPVIVEQYGQKVEFKNTLTQDAYFCEKLFRAGYKAYVDTKLQCMHVDKQTKKVFGSPKYTKDFAFLLPESWRFAINEVQLKLLDRDDGRV
jgi:hypothetical protein